jgi:hypothetical protein
MNFYIQVKDGTFVNYPAFEDNLIQAFGSIPEDWEPCITAQNPTIENKNLVLVQPEPTYEKHDGVWYEKWFVREKTEEELAQEAAALKQKKIEAAKKAFAEFQYAHHFVDWVFNEDTIQFDPPISRPTDGKFYRWHGPSKTWREAVPLPKDGKRYYFDFDNWVNVEITNVPSE